MRFHHTSLERWQAIADADELSATDDLVDDGALLLTDATRVRIAVRQRRDARRRVRVPSCRWDDVIDRQTREVLWTPPVLVCTPPRSWLLDDGTRIRAGSRVRHTPTGEREHPMPPAGATGTVDCIAGPGLAVVRWDDGGQAMTDTRDLAIIGPPSEAKAI